MSRTAKAKARPVSERPTAARSPRSPEPAASGRISAASEECSVDMPMLLDALQCMRIGNFSVRLPHDQAGIAGKIVDVFNEIVAANEQMARQLEEIGQVVGRDGNTRKRAKFSLTLGAWGDMEASINALVDDLLWPTNTLTRAIAAVARGDLLHTVPLEVYGRPLKGEFLRSATIVNTMIKQLRMFTSEVTRVAREVGSDGKLGGQAQVREVTGVWKDLTESVNSMANNLTAQVRNIANVTIAVANGDLSKKITVDVRGEISAAQGGHQYHGGSAPFVCLGGDACRARGWHGRQAGRPSSGSGRRRDVERPDRFGQCDVRQPYRPGPQYRPRDNGGRPRGSFA